MNPPHPTAAELIALTGAFDTVLHSLSAPGPAPDHLAGPLTTLVDLTARLGSQVRDAHAALAAAAPADQPSHAATITELYQAVGAAGRAVSALAAAQDAHLFIDHFADRYGHPHVNTAFAHSRITAALTSARDHLTDASSHLRHLTDADSAAQLLRAARARSRPATGNHADRPSLPAATAAPPTPPGRGPKH